LADTHVFARYEERVRALHSRRRGESPDGKIAVDSWIEVFCTAIQVKDLSHPIVIRSTAARSAAGNADAGG